MSQANISLNIPSETKNSALISQLPLINIEAYDESSADKRSTGYSLSGTDAKTVNSKKLASIVGFKDDNKLTTGASLTKSFNTPSFHSPEHSSSPHNKSIRQRIGNMKPITPTHSIPNNDDEMSKNIDFSQLEKTRIVVRDSNSPQRESSVYLRNGTDLAQNMASNNQSIFYQGSEDKSKQFQQPFHKVQNPMRVSRSYLNTSSNANGRAFSHSPTSNQYYSTSTLGAQSNKMPAISPSFTQNNMMNNTLTGTEKNITGFPARQRGQSFVEETEMEKIMSTKKPGRLPSASMHLHPSFFAGEKGQSEQVSEKLKLNLSGNSSASILGQEGQLNSKNDSFSIGKSVNSTSSYAAQSNIWNNSQSQLGRGEYLENRIEKLLASKSTELQHIDDISALFDSYLDSICDNGSKEGSKIRGMLRKIKLAYELFFQNYSLNINRKLTEVQDYNYKLEQESRKLVAKMNEMNSEIEFLRKENQKLVTQNKLHRSVQSPSNSSSSKYQPLSTEDSPPGAKAQIEAYKAMIAEQQQMINSMKKKEAKMIKLLYACKKRGLDLEQIYHEEMKAGQETTTRDEEEISVVSKGQKPVQSNQPNIPQLQLQVLHQQPQGQNQVDSKVSNGSDSVDTSAITESDLGDKYSEMDYSDLYDQPVSDDNAKLNVDPVLKNKLKLDFSQLGINMKPSTQLANNEQKPHPVAIAVKKNLIVQQKPPALNLGDIKDQQEKIVGYHDEFMSKIDEFSESWRNAALNERKIP